MTRIVIVPRNEPEPALWPTTAEVAGLFRPWVGPFHAITRIGLPG